MSKNSFRHFGSLLTHKLQHEVVEAHPFHMGSDQDVRLIFLGEGERLVHAHAQGVKREQNLSK